MVSDMISVSRLCSKRMPINMVQWGQDNNIHQEIHVHCTEQKVSRLAIEGSEGGHISWQSRDLGPEWVQSMQQWNLPLALLQNKKN